jgi:hypothetical protein
MRKKLTAILLAFVVFFGGAVAVDASHATPAEAATHSTVYHDANSYFQTQIPVTGTARTVWPRPGQIGGSKDNPALSFYVPNGQCAVYGWNGQQWVWDTHRVYVPKGTAAWVRTFRC